MNQDFVKEKMEEFLCAMKKEKLLRLRLCAIDFSLGSESRHQENMQKQAKLLSEIEEVRNSTMLPILKMLGDIIKLRLSQRQPLQNSL